MKKRYLVFTIFLIFLLFLSFAFGGPDDVWKECTTPGSEPVGTDTYHCCISGTSYYWQKNILCDVVTPCGDGTIDQLINENCDFSPEGNLLLGGETCDSLDLGFTDGDLGCYAAGSVDAAGNDIGCTYDISECTTEEPACTEDWDPDISPSEVCSGLTVDQFKCKGTQLEQTQKVAGTKVCAGTWCNGRFASSIDDILTPSGTGDFQTISSSLSSKLDTKRYRVDIPTTGDYEFSLCPFDGGNANWDTWLCLFDSSQRPVTDNDDFDYNSCDVQSKISIDLGSGVYYLQVSGYNKDDAFGDYTLAYKGSPPLDVGEQECYDWTGVPTSPYSDYISEIRYGPYCANNYDGDCD